jgi:hypothetical protein
MALSGSSVSLSIDGSNVRHAIPPAMDPWDVAGVPCGHADSLGFR